MLDFVDSVSIEAADVYISISKLLDRELQFMQSFGILGKHIEEIQVATLHSKLISTVAISCFKQTDSRFRATSGWDRKHVGVVRLQWLSEREMVTTFKYIRKIEYATHWWFPFQRSLYHVYLNFLA